MTDFPTPALDGASAPFWLALRAGRLDVQACGACGVLRHPPRPVCSQCRSTSTTWTTVSGRAEVWSHTTIHPPTLPAFAEATPYHAYVVRLAEGPFLVVRAAAGIDDRLAIGSTVVIGAETAADDVVLPTVRPA